MAIAGGSFATDGIDERQKTCHGQKQIPHERCVQWAKEKNVIDMPDGKSGKRWDDDQTSRMMKRDSVANGCRVIRPVCEACAGDGKV